MSRTQRERFFGLKDFHSGPGDSNTIQGGSTLYSFCLVDLVILAKLHAAAAAESQNASLVAIEEKSSKVTSRTETSRALTRTSIFLFFGLPAASCGW